MTIKQIQIKIISILKQIIFIQQTLLIKKLKKKRECKYCMRQMIELIAKQEGIDPSLAVRVAICESNLNPYAVNYNPKNGTDRGLFQWNNLYHPEITDEMAFDPEKSTRLFCQAVKEGHLYWWSSSRQCWNK